MIHLHIYIVFYILLHYGLSQDVEYSSLCYTVGPCGLSILSPGVFTQESISNCSSSPSLKYHDTCL